MNFNDHSNLEGLHALLSPSQYHWVNYDEDKMVNKYDRWRAAQRGTELHAFASEAIRLGIKLKAKNTLSMYVNDAIGFKMHTDQILYFSDYCFGTCDAISFRKNCLRISDYKSGVTKASMMQLRVYAALFCLEYGVKPNDIQIELRLYQSDEVIIDNPEPEEIFNTMDTIIQLNKVVEKLEAGG